MPPIPPQLVQITCPNCGTNYQTNIHTIVDVTQQPELKQALLSGRLNVASCPRCGLTTMLGTQLVYHDATKQLYLVYIPQELNLSQEQQERLVGETTSLLMRSLPPNTPRGHLFTPRRLISLASLIDTILEADGIPREVLEQQRRRVDLLSQLLSTLPNEQQFANLVEQRKAELTPEFFATLEQFIQAGAQEGQNESVQMLTMLRESLASLTGFAGEQVLQENDPDVQEVIERLIAVADEDLDEAIADARPLIDYSFFQAWTTHIENMEQEGKVEEAQRLTNRRAQILEAIERMDREAQALFEAGANTLRDILQAEDLQAALEAHSERIDEAFMLVVSANIAHAQRAGQTEIAKRLEEISHLALEVIQSRLSPEERLINALMLAETPQESTRLLRGNAAQVTPDFVKKLNEMAEQQEKRGNKENGDKLRRFAREAGALLF